MQYDDDVEESVVSSRCVPNKTELFADAKASLKEANDVEKIGEEDEEDEDMFVDAAAMFIER
jgi:hypothetical protein